MDAAIYANLIEMAVAATQPGQPSNATSRLDAFCGFDNTAAVYEFLREGGCQPHDAERAGIASLDDWGAQRLHAGLMGVGRIWMPLRSPDGVVFDVMTEEGCVRPHVVDLSELFRDATIANALQTKKRLYAVPSVLDAALYRAAGLAAIPYRVLDGISIDDLIAGLHIMHEAMWGKERTAARASAAALDSPAVPEPPATKYAATKSAANQPPAITDVSTDFVGDEALLGIVSDDLPLPAPNLENAASPITLPLIAPAVVVREGPSPEEHTAPSFKSDREAPENGLGPGMLAILKPEAALEVPSQSDDPDDGYDFDYFVRDYGGAQRNYDTGHWLFVVDGSPAQGQASKLPACEHLLDHLSALCNLGLDPEGIRIWRLDSDDLSGIAACARLGSEDALTRFILDRTSANLKPLLKPKRPPVMPLGEAALAIYRSLDRGFRSPSAISEACTQFMKSVEVNILEPLLAKIDAGATPAESLKTIRLAHLLREYFGRQADEMSRPDDRPQDPKQAIEALKREHHELLIDGELHLQIQKLLQEDDECRTRTDTRPLGYWSAQIRRLPR